jgi:hypothetical protein
MKTLTLTGSILLALGIAGVIWGIVEMRADRDTFEVGDVRVVVDQGEFPPVGIAGAIGAGVGILMIAGGAIGSRKR